MTYLLSEIPFAMTAFVTLLVVIDPFALIPLLVGLLGDKTEDQRQEIMSRSLRFAFGIALFFLLAGRWLLSSLGVSLYAFTISGGILLFLVAMPMLFGNRGGLMSVGQGENVATADIAVFPIAIPLTSGPGTLTTLLVLAAAAKGDITKEVVLVGALALVFLLTAIVLRHGTALMTKIGQSGVHVVTRVLGIILAALAAQFVLSGVAGYLKGVHLGV